MRFRTITLALFVITMLSLSTAAMNIPALFGSGNSKSLLQGFPDLLNGNNKNSVKNNQQLTPATSNQGIFELTVQGNVYFDKIPVKGAEVSIYVNNKYKGKSTAGDIYMFKVPGVRTGDIIKVMAKYNGSTGEATEKVKFKSMYLDVNIKSGSSFIRRMLEMMPSEEELSKTQSQQQQTPQTTTQQPATNAGSTNPFGGSNDRQLLDSVFKQTGNALSDTIGKSYKPMDMTQLSV